MITKSKVIAAIVCLFLLGGIFSSANKQQTAVKGASVSVPTFTHTSIPSNTPTVTLSLTPTLYTSPTQSIIPSSQTTSTQDQGLSNNNYYRNSSGNEVHTPANSDDDSVPSGATAKCIDGTYSFSQHRSGTCSHHGGVSQWL